VFHTSKRVAKKNAAEEKVNTERFSKLFNTSNFVDWTPEETLFFFRYLVEHPNLFTAYTVKIEKDVLKHTTDPLLVEKIFKLITEYHEAFNPEELYSNWQMIEYHVAMLQYLQRYMKENFTKVKANG